MSKRPEYVCNRCGWIFTRKSNLTHHLISRKTPCIGANKPVDNMGKLELKVEDKESVNLSDVADKYTSTYCDDEEKKAVDVVNGKCTNTTSMEPGLSEKTSLKNKIKKRKFTESMKGICNCKYDKKLQYQLQSLLTPSPSQNKFRILEKELLRRNKLHMQAIERGRYIFEIINKGVVMEDSLSTEYKHSLDMYRKSRKSKEKLGRNNTQTLEC